jgi:hypothetical protein
VVLVVLGGVTAIGCLKLMQNLLRGEKTPPVAGR